METLTVRTRQPYRVLIENGLLDRIGQELCRVCPPCRAAVVSDDTVDARYGDRAAASLASAGYETLRFVFPHGEASKNLQTYGQLMTFLCQNNLTRGDMLISLGGGVTGDLAGFAAATYLRGVRYAQIPTTLLAMVDSSVGGKTAVDLPGAKNACGAFWQPSLVLCDPMLLATLPEAEVSNGLAECVKHAVLEDPALLSLTSLPLADAQGLIARSIAIKESYVCTDERDVGRRQFLNLGHTVGHAAEALSGYRMRHGEGVAMGMAYMARIACALSLCGADTVQAIENALTAANLPVDCPYSAKDLCAYVLRDKKRRGQEITLVLPEKIGKCRLHTVQIGDLPALLALGEKA